LYTSTHILYSIRCWTGSQCSESRIAAVMRSYFPFMKNECISVELRHHAKFCGDESNICRDISILDFLRWRLPPSWIFKFYFNHLNEQEGRTASLCQISSKSLEGHLVVFITVQSLVGIDAVVLIICTFFDFASLAWKRLFTPQNRGFWGFLTTFRGSNVKRS